MSTTKRCRLIIRQAVPNSDQRYFRIQEAAEYLRATVWFMYTQVWRGTIPSQKVGKRIVFDRVDLDNFMRNGKSGTV